MAEQTPHIEPTLSARGSLAPEYFERLYAASADPWDFEASAYEAEKYTATLAALPRPRYTNALELGCSIGVLTRQLAQRCERLLATDVSEAALAQARVRCTDLPHVIFERRDVSKEFPDDLFDLILVSEVGYYFSTSDLENLRAQIANALAPRGHLLLVHYTGKTNYPLSADEVHDAFLAWQGRPWRRLKANRSDCYRLDLLEKSETASVPPTGARVDQEIQRYCEKVHVVIPLRLLCQPLPAKFSPDSMLRSKPSPGGAASPNLPFFAKLWRR